MTNQQSLNPQAAEAALERTARWITRFGGRLTGTPACHAAAEALAADLDQACGNARIEPFTTRPGAFYGFYRIDVVIYVVSLALLILKRPLIAGLLLTFMLTAAGLQFGWYTPWMSFCWHWAASRFSPSGNWWNPGQSPAREIT